MGKRKRSELTSSDDDDLQIISATYEPLSKKRRIRIWRCSLCSFDNQHNGSQCVMCENTNHSHMNTNKEKHKSNINTIQPTTWNCEWCTFTNTVDQSSCSMCCSARHKRDKISSQQKPKQLSPITPMIVTPNDDSIDAQTNSIPNDTKWECIYCTFINHHLLSECDICHFAKKTVADIIPPKSTNNDIIKPKSTNDDLASSTTAAHNHLSSNRTSNMKTITIKMSSSIDIRPLATPPQRRDATSAILSSNSNHEHISNDKMHLAKQELRRFGHRSFRSSQLPVVKSLISGNNTLLILPTGGGKSLCFQIPILVLNKLCNQQQSNNDIEDIQSGIAVIISPLISLMNDQIQKLKSIGIDAEFINSSLSRSERQNIQQRIKNNEIEMLYCAPELLTAANGSIMEMLNKHRIITMLVIDEAHCISEWGHSFRPSYRRIRHIRDVLNDPLIMACTATATQRVRDDILMQLGLNRSNCELHIGSFDRPNIYLKAIKTHTSNDEHLERIILQEIKEYQQRKRTAYKDPVIIYCGTQRETNKTVDYLNKNIERLNMHSDSRYFNMKENKVGAYHAGMSDAERKEVQQQFIDGETNIIAATNAFGMGIDKDNVGLVIHKTCPLSIESYYQQIGRAGRNGEESMAVIIADKSKRRRNFIASYSEHMVNRENPKDHIIERIADIICEEFPLHEQKTCVVKKIVEKAGFNVFDDYVVDGTVIAVIKMLQKYKVVERINKRSLPIHITFLKHDDNPGRIRRDTIHYKLWNELVARRQNQNEIDINELQITRKLNIASKELTTALQRLKANKLITYSSLTRSGAIKLLIREWRNNVEWEEIRKNRDEALMKEKKMRQLMNTTRCKRKMLLEYFTQRYVAGSNPRCCDKCNPYIC